MGDNKKWTRRAAVGSFVSGGGFMLFGTGGSTQITSNRDVTVNTGDDEDAVVRFVDRSENADVVDSTDGEEVYVIEDGVGEFNINRVSVSGTTGSGNDSVRIEVVEDEESPNSFSVKAACPNEPTTFNDDFLKLLFELDNDDQTITATRTTNNRISFDCGTESYDYGDSANYRDNSGNTDNSNIPPGNNAKGEVLNPERLNQRNENDPNDPYAILQGESNKRGNSIDGANIGFALPPVPESEKYVLDVFVSDKQPGGDWVVDVVDGDKNPLTRAGNGKKDKLKKGLNSFEFELNEEKIDPLKQIKLYLIFRMTSSGNNKKAEIDYFELKPTQNSTS
ncbi:hypothetical protein SAMN06266787_106129 [Halorubrum ezzemoulense]|uniref:Uncharacterized protein n=1 Tax=Halorubrum ezzemoulense TaxID=337243 RepID=A0A238XVF3_HALEZ|nr:MULTISPECIES: hypothetical protein [Halorubrum]TKX36928.1 hypothetical protein EXE52_15915 [Halorubrum sp. CGM4_25_10-8A]SNR61979.1 hypothetical protein SAMN06266787_106129 [Halorubrum ezzemoulense]